MEALTAGDQKDHRGLRQCRALLSAGRAQRCHLDVYPRASKVIAVFRSS
jgi:hypothetical protein